MANFPSSSTGFGSTGFQNINNNVEVTVSGSQTDIDTSIELSSGHGARLPSANFVLFNNRTGEYVFCSSRSTDTCTVTRGFESANGGAAAAAMNDGDTLVHVVSRTAVTKLEEEVEAVTKVLLGETAGNLVVDGSFTADTFAHGAAAFSVNAAGDVVGTSFTGDGSGLTGIASGTGGVTNTGSTTIGADTDLDGVGVIAFQTRGVTRLTVENLGTEAGGLTFENLFGGLSQPYRIMRGGLSASFLGIQSRTSGVTSELDLFTMDGDGTDNIELRLYAKGLPNAATNRELLSLGYSSSDVRFNIFTGVGGTGTVRPLHIYTGSNTSQLVLAINGTITSSATNLNITSSNVGIGQSTYGTSAAKVLAIGNGTAPTTSPADAVQLYSADLGGTAGQASPHYRSENGAIIGLGGSIALGGGSAPTLGTIGGSGPASAGQVAWLRISIGGTLSYIPYWQ